MYTRTVVYAHSSSSQERPWWHRPEKTHQQELHQVLACPCSTRTMPFSNKRTTKQPRPAEWQSDRTTRKWGDIEYPRQHEFFPRADGGVIERCPRSASPGCGAEGGLLNDLADGPGQGPDAKRLSIRQVLFKRRSNDKDKNETYTSVDATRARASGAMQQRGTNYKLNTYGRGKWSYAETTR